ncbi:MAG: ABC-2 family transporter protein [Candidatus Nanoarchaeia archaeon]|jgi:ABC-2 type transport system permease protein
MNYFFAFFFKAFKEATTSRFSSIVWALGKVLFIILNFYLWQAIYSYDGRAVINGLSMEETINYMLFSGMMVGLLYNEIHNIVRRDVQKGDISIKLLKPIDYGFQQLALVLGDRLYSVFIEIIPALTIAFIFFNFKIYGLLNFSFSLASFLASMILNFYIDLNISLINFKYIDKFGTIQIFKNIIKNLFSGAILPLNFFPQILQGALKFFPTTYLTYVPIMIYLGKLSAIDILFSFFYQILLIIIFYFIYKFFYKRLTKSFEGVGV